MKLSIGKKILLSLLVVALVPLIVAGLITYRATEESMQQEVLSGLSALSESTLEHFVDYVNEKKSMVALLSNTPVIIKALEEYESALKKEHGRDDSAVLDRSYRLLLEFYTYLGFSDLYLLSASGDVVFSLLEKGLVGHNILRGHYRDTELAGVFKRTKVTLKTEVSEFKIFPPTEKPAAFISSPVMKGREVVGFMAFKLDTEGLYRHVRDYTGLGETGEIVLGELDGENILFVAPLRHDPHAAFTRKVRIGSMAALPMQHALNKEDGEGISIDYRGKRTVAVWRYFAPLGLGLVIKQDASEAFSLFGNLRRWFLIVGTLTVFFVLAVSALAARSIARPIRALHEGAERVGEGDLACRVGTSSSDEIGQLSRAFDDMTSNLQRITASRDDLDKEIAQRREAEKGLKHSEERLLEYSKTLEDKVEKRTTALKGLQKELLIKEKLAAIGQLSSSVGHELRNPLGVIGNSVYYLNMKLKHSDDT
ncbi:MAG: HAMP domain-containing protein, partial [Thermodesulfobacteriota bacterium]